MPRAEHGTTNPLFCAHRHARSLSCVGYSLLACVFCSDQTDLFLKNPSRFADVARAHVEQHARQDASGVASKEGASGRGSCSPRAIENGHAGDSREASHGDVAPSAIGFAHRAALCADGVVASTQRSGLFGVDPRLRRSGSLHGGTHRLPASAPSLTRDHRLFVLVTFLSS